MTDTLCEFHSGITEQLDTLKASDKRQWAAIERLQNRLPVWATLLMSVLTFFLGCAITMAVQFHTL